MNARIRTILVLSVLIVTGALLGATPLFSYKQESNTTSKFNFDISYESTSNTNELIQVSDYGQVEQGSFFLKKSDQQGYLLSPLVDTNVEFNITGLVARARVTQEFSNPTDDWLNGIYAFPLPDNAAVDHLEMQIGERQIVGQIQPKQKAKRMYEKAKKSGKKASLLVQNRPNLFTNSVANIGPGEKIKITIEYQQAIKFDSGIFSLRFPTTITERYLPVKKLESTTIATGANGWGLTQPKFIEDDQFETPEQAPQNKVAISIILNSGFPLANINSKHHPIQSPTMKVLKANIK